MIEVNVLSKSFGPHKAVDGVSFSVARGEVVGFLGKNGAGKTTTMRMLAGSLAVGGGTATVGGFDVTRESRKVRALVGYLPEILPLYQEMKVQSFLTFCARLRGIKDTSAAVERVIGETGLSAVQSRVIANLSKGYRQRVGIAQALVHRPRVLLLDEPVSGLDPTQRRDIRELIQTLSDGETTVLLSTHVLGEIEAICDRVLIIDEGRLIAAESIAELAKEHARVHLRVMRPDASLTEALLAVEGILSVSDQGDGEYVLDVDGDVREKIGAIAVKYGLIELQTPLALEEAFVRLTEGEA